MNNGGDVERLSGASRPDKPTSIEITLGRSSVIPAFLNRIAIEEREC
jgi:hypothetical protein